jgi:hypothetical protein
MRILFTILLFIILNTICKAQLREVVLYMPHNDLEKQTDSLNQSLQSLQGVTFEGICTKLQVAMFTLDVQYHESNDVFYNWLKQNHWLFYEKTDVSIEQVLATCDMPPSQKPRKQ